MKYITTSVPGKIALCSEKRYSAPPMASGICWTPSTGISSECAARTAEYSGMNALTSYPRTRRFGTRAPTTSARPPVFAYGKISELRTHNFNAGMRISLAAETRVWQAGIAVAAE